MTEIDAVRADNIALKAECERLRQKLERCQYRAMEIVRAWGEYHELSVLKDRIDRAPWQPRKTNGNGHSSRPVAE
jgi:hypothetical protein